MSHSHRKAAPQRSHPWTRLLATLGVVLAFAITATFTAPASALASPVRTGSLVSAAGGGLVNPHVHTCDDPERPCYTAPQMHSYFVADTHGFHHLSDGFRFPGTFIHQAQAAQASWCGAHPIWCQHMWDRFHRQGKATGLDATCKPHAWWCYERGWISCAGGALVPYWSCAPLSDQATRSRVDDQLSDTEKVVITGVAAVIATYLTGGTAPLIFGNGITATFSTWIGLQ